MFRPSATAQRLATAWQARLSPFQKAAVMMLGASFAFAVMAILIRLATQEMHPLMAAFLRNVFATLFLLPWLLRTGLQGLYTGRITLHLGRATSGIIAMSLWFSSLAYLPLAEATALNFTVPLFTTLGAIVLFKEVVRLRRWAAIFFGLVGVAVILRPGFQEISLLMLLPLGASVFMAISALSVKTLAKSEKSVTIVLYQNLFLVPLSLLPALFVWDWPGGYGLFIIALVGATSLVAHLLIAQSFKLVDVSAVTPFGYLRLPLIALFGYLFFGEVTDVWTWVGAAIIMASSLYIAYRESQLKTESPEERQAKYTSKSSPG